MHEVNKYISISFIQLHNPYGTKLSNIRNKSKKSLKKKLTLN